MRVFLLYPPGEMYQRGEDRCQISIKSSTANAMRACNDLGYIASVLRKYGDEVFLKDYATEGLPYRDYLTDIQRFHPDVLILSTTNATIYSDIGIINRTISETGKKCKVILKGAIFFDAPKKLMEIVDLSNVDVLVGGEIEWVIGDVVHQSKAYNEIPCIIYKENGNWVKTDFSKYNEDLDSIPFPARDLMRNELYVRPDTGEAMATIQTGHGCPSNCIYCLTPKISGRRLRLRSPRNVLEEMEECYHKYGIKNFFFRADTFTYQKEWVLELCGLLRKSDMYGKIQYTANSRVKPLSKEVLHAMKDTGCFMVAFGLETGDPDTMERIRKGVEVDDNYKAIRMAKEAGIPVLGFFMMGFPWETAEHLKKTRRFILSTDCDFIEIHMALPYYGTELYGQCQEAKVLEKNLYGNDIFHASTTGTKYVAAKELLKFRRNTILMFYLRPKYILKKLAECKGNLGVFGRYVKYGFRMLGNMFFQSEKGIRLPRYHQNIQRERRYK